MPLAESIGAGPHSVKHDKATGVCHRLVYRRVRSDDPRLGHFGRPAVLERAEQLTREASAAADISYELKPKDGTFYAPKIDIYIDDALGREWQMATIQIDLTMLPERFDLSFVDAEGQHQRPIAIHRAGFSLR